MRQASLARLARYGIPALLLLLAHLITGEPISIISQTENCRVRDGTRICTILSSTTLSLLPAGQPTTLLIKDRRGDILGALMLTLKALTLNCNPKTLTYLRSYRISTRSVWRCPSGGSCSGSFCSHVGAKTHIPELVEVMDKPGSSGCLESSALWSKGCGFPTASCYFYRWYAIPMTLDVFELFECPTWDFHIKTSLQLTVNDQIVEETVTLHPGLTHHWANISLTPISVTNPPAPVLSTPFLTHGFAVALGDGVPTDLKCQDRPSAAGFGCNISADTCKDCRPTPDGSITCQCRELDGEAILADPAKRLPLTIGRHTFLTEDDQVYVEQSYTPIQINLQMNNFQLVTEITESTCRVIINDVSGCYRCLTGVQIKYSCSTDFGSSLANIKCDDGIHFIARCSFNGTEGVAHFAYNRSKIDTECQVRCPGGDNQLNIKGQLLFIPIQWRQERIVQSSKGEKSSSWNFNPLRFHPISLIMATLPMPSPIYLLLISILVIIAVYSFLRFKFIVWRKMSSLLITSLLINNFAVEGEGALRPLSIFGNLSHPPPSTHIYSQITTYPLFEQKEKILDGHEQAKQMASQLKMFATHPFIKNKLLSHSLIQLTFGSFRLLFIRKILFFYTKECAKTLNLVLHTTKSHQHISIGLIFSKKGKDNFYFSFTKEGRKVTNPHLGRKKSAHCFKSKAYKKEEFGPMLTTPPNLSCLSTSPRECFFILISTKLFLNNINKVRKIYSAIMPLGDFFAVPPRKPGDTKDEYLQACLAVGYTPTPPEKGQSMADYIPKELGLIFFDSLCGNEARRRGEGLLTFFWEKLRCHGIPLPDEEPCLSRAAREELVEPNLTVAQFFRSKGKALNHPDLPCIIIKGGVRGSSRKSRRHARVVGHQCWKVGESHKSFFPLEHIIYDPTGTDRDLGGNSATGFTPPSSPPPELPPGEGPPIEEEHVKDKENNELKISFPRGGPPIRALSILFAIAVFTVFINGNFVCCLNSPDISLSHFNSFLPIEMKRNSTDNSNSKANKKAKENLYLEVFGPPTSAAQQQEMEQHLKEINVEQLLEIGNKPVIAVAPEEMENINFESTTSTLLKTTSEIIKNKEINKINSASQDGKQIGEKQQEKKEMPAASTKQNSLVVSVGEGKIELGESNKGNILMPDLKAKLEKERLKQERQNQKNQSLVEAFFSFAQKLTAQQPVVNAPAATGGVCEKTATHKEAVNKFAVATPAQSEWKCSSSSGRSNGGEREKTLGEQDRGDRVESNDRYSRSGSGRSHWGVSDQHTETLRKVRTTTGQLCGQISDAIHAMESGRAKLTNEEEHDLLAIDGAAKRLMKSIHIAFGHSRRSR